MDDLIKELIAVMEEKGFSAGTMALYIGCSPKQVDRWVLGQAKPTHVYQKLIKAGIRKVRKF